MVGSDLLKIYNGVPQGPLLGPVIFNALSIFLMLYQYVFQLFSL
jgi:hypothetical protein